MVTEAMENYTNEEVGQSPLVLAKAPAVIENHQFIRGGKLWTYLRNEAIKRYVRSHIVNCVPHSSALKTISSFDYCNYLSAVAMPTAPVRRLVGSLRSYYGYAKDYVV